MCLLVAQLIECFCTELAGMRLFSSVDELMAIPPARAGKCLPAKLASMSSLSRVGVLMLVLVEQ